MRITNTYLTNNKIYNIQQNIGRLARSEEQIATSKRMLRPSDDPAQLGELLKIKAALSYREQYAINVEDGLSYMDVTDTSMSTLNSVLSLAWKYTIQAANDTYDPEDRKAIAQQIDKMMDQVVDLGNATVGGRYVYGGTKNDMPPFERIGDKIIFKGNTAEVRREVAAATNYRVDAPGINTGFKIDMRGTLEPPKIISRQEDTQLQGAFKIEVTADDGNQATQIKLIYGPEADDYIMLDETIITDENPGTGETPGDTGDDTNDDTGDGTNPGTGNDTDTDQDDTEAAIEISSLVNGILTIGDDEEKTAHLKGLKIDLRGCLEQAEYNFSIENTVGVFGNANWDPDEQVYVLFDINSPKELDDVNWGLFDSLFNLRDNLNNNDTPGLQRNVVQIKTDMDNVLRHQVAVGARFNHFEALKDMLLDQEVKLTQNMNNIEGADVTRLSIDFNQQLLTYNASLAIGANIMNTSLLNYLK